jgi:hypothetical protein
MKSTNTHGQNVEVFNVNADVTYSCDWPYTNKGFVYLKEYSSVHSCKHCFFLKILEQVTELIRSEAVQKNLLASVVLCLAELVSALRAHAIGSLNQFMPTVIKVLHAQRELET